MMTHSVSAVRNRIRDKLARAEVVVSMTVRLVRTPEIAPIAHAAGFDGLYVDLEHGTLALDDASQICIAALAVGITPFVRVPPRALRVHWAESRWGALGVIVPHVESAEDARRAVSAARFPPRGFRSSPGPLPQLHYRAIGRESDLSMLDAVTMVVVQIESQRAVDNVEAIAAIDGLDVVLVGTNDLCMDLGLPGRYDHDRVREAYARVIASYRRHGKHVGVGGLSSRPDLISEFVRQGARYVSAGTDLGFLLTEAARGAREARALS
jgi:4-hydroxy-2-oxoheptanedioate aldolase